MLVWLSPSLLLHPVFPWTKGHPLGICTRGFAAATHPHPHPHAEVPWARSTGSLPKPVVVGDAWTHPSGHPLAQSCIQSSSSSEIPPSPCLWDMGGGWDTPAISPWISPKVAARPMGHPCLSPSHCREVQPSFCQRGQIHHLESRPLQQRSLEQVQHLPPPPTQGRARILFPPKKLEP